MRCRSTAATAILMLMLCSGPAQTASLESLVMPGEVIEGHAEIEEECGSCHDMFDRSTQQQLCLDCHEPVRDDLTAGTGFHGLSPDASSGDCKQCHAEHKGRDADITGLAPDLFDHNLTDFTLLDSHVAPGCGACHGSDERHAEAPVECVGCHADDDVHQELLGAGCADCHDATRWRSTSFDHATTEFPLLGNHADASCLACHADQTFESPTDSGECISCHKSDDVHNGGNGDACDDCHDSSSWAVAFDHHKETGFDLLGAHGNLSCRNCHLADSDYADTPTDCQGCHSGDDVHLGGNGTDCEGCHTQSEWSTSFDHLEKTGFELAGTHAIQTCSACHSEGLEMPLATDCAGCHDSNDPHDESLPLCESCHGQSSWHEELRFTHDLADFALVGLHRTASCEQCHDSLVFSPLGGECSNCHFEDDVHDTAMGEACETCHSPAGWNLWLFDHGAATSFELDGVHQTLACATCHTRSSPAGAQSSACATCHRSDDIHNGGFGQQCDRCHLTSNFQELKRDL